MKHLKWGAANTPYQHFLKPVYENGLDKIRKTKCGKDLPNGRVIGNEMAKIAYSNSCNGTAFPCPCECAKDVTTGYWNNVFFVFFGQLITHDVSYRNFYQMKGVVDKNASNGIRCCSEDDKKPLPSKYRNSQCHPIQYPKDDPYFSKVKIFCTSYIKLQPMLDNDCQLKHVQHVSEGCTIFLGTVLIIEFETISGKFEIELFGFIHDLFG